MNARIGILLAVTTIVVFGQNDSGPRVRGMWNEAFAAKRPGVPIAAKKADKTEEVRDEDSFLGVTIWRMRRARPVDPPGVRLLVHRSEAPDELTPVRVSANTPLSEGERIRMTVESARAGYLYVVSREVYLDGSQGTPYLIFPAVQLRGGSNRVEPGLVVELPSWTDKPPYLTLEKSRSDHTAEQVLFLVSPTPIPDLMATRIPVALSPERLAEWNQRWGLTVETLEAPAEVGKSMTEREKAAAVDGDLLSQNDPVPQTLYRTKTEGDGAMLAVMQLAFSSQR